MRNLTIVFLVLLLSSCTKSFYKDEFTVSGIENGNTIILKNGYSVTLLGVPDTEESAQYLKELIDKKVRFKFDKSSPKISISNKNSDKHLYAYVRLKKKCINANIISQVNDVTFHEYLQDSLAVFCQYAKVASSNRTQEVTLIEVEESDRGREMKGSEIFETYNSAVFMIYTSDGWSDFQGSGFFITPNGIGVSNYHVFEGTTIGFENIKLTDGSTFKIKEVLGHSKENDFIIFKIDSQGERFNYIPISNILPIIGEKAYAIGSPRGLENTFSSGEISQLRGEHLIQISVPIDHGSSGGALMNCYGEAIGITTAGIDESGANLNFATSIQPIRKILSDMNSGNGNR